MTNLIERLEAEAFTMGNAWFKVDGKLLEHTAALLREAAQALRTLTPSLVETSTAASLNGWSTSVTSPPLKTEGE